MREAGGFYHIMKGVYHVDGSRIAILLMHEAGVVYHMIKGVYDILQGVYHADLHLFKKRAPGKVLAYRLVSSQCQWILR